MLVDQMIGAGREVDQSNGQTGTWHRPKSWDVRWISHGSMGLWIDAARTLR